jgi:CheY-like chemotaxis protein
MGDSADIHSNLKLRTRPFHEALETKLRFLLSDMQMPIMDGYTLAGKLRNKGWSRGIIAITAHAMTGDLEKCRAAGCDGYISKPIDKNKLIEACRKHAGISGPESY